MFKQIAVVFLLTLIPAVTQAQFVAEDQMTVELEQFTKAWNQQGWNAPEGNRKYLRSLDDDSWKSRMVALSVAAAGDQSVVEQLMEALNSPHDATRILAAQALGYTLADPPTDRVIEHITREEELEAVRLYLVDALAMHGVTDIPDLWGDWRPRGRDFRKHLKYAEERAGERLQREVMTALGSWDARLADSAEVGQPAPDFELRDLNGEMISLSDYRGKKSVVLTFVYGDT